MTRGPLFAFLLWEMKVRAASISLSSKTLPLRSCQAGLQRFPCRHVLEEALWLQAQPQSVLIAGFS